MRLGPCDLHSHAVLIVNDACILVSKVAPSSALQTPLVHRQSPTEPTAPPYESIASKCTCAEYLRLALFSAPDFHARPGYMCAGELQTGPVGLDRLIANRVDSPDVLGLEIASGSRNSSTTGVRGEAGEDSRETCLMLDGASLTRFGVEEDFARMRMQEADLGYSGAAKQCREGREGDLGAFASRLGTRRLASSHARGRMNYDDLVCCLGSQESRACVQLLDPIDYHRMMKVPTPEPSGRLVRRHRRVGTRTTY